MFILVGEGRYIRADEVVSVADLKTFIHSDYKELEKQGLVIIDVTGGKTPCSIIFMKNNTAFVCAMLAKTVMNRIADTEKR